MINFQETARRIRRWLDRLVIRIQCLFKHDWETWNVPLIKKRKCRRCRKGQAIHALDSPDGWHDCDDV